jgi:iron-sulfur cluster protein
MQEFNQEARDQIRKATLNIECSKEDSLKRVGLSEEDYKKKMQEIRKKCLNNFENSIETAKENFQKNGIVVHEARSKEDAQEIIKKLTVDSERIVKSKTNTGNEIDLAETLKDFNYSETDLGDFVASLMEEDGIHYVLPALHIKSGEIVKKIEEKFGEKIDNDAGKITRYLCDVIRKNILEADTGITGANFITKNGEVVLLENEGNISLVSRLPKKHIVLCGINKIVENASDAMELSRAAAVFGTGQYSPQYISVISGPSKTADISSYLVEGAQGAREVHLVLIDGGLSDLMKDENFGDLSSCIGCGACLNFCPSFNELGREYGGKAVGIKGMISEYLKQKESDEKLAKNFFKCILCGTCTENCPMGIDLAEMSRKIREELNEKGEGLTETKKMLETIEKYGNPFGEKKKTDKPDKLYCCSNRDNF